MFIDCVEEIDDIPMRQLPIFEKNLYSTLWISENGMLRRRYYNVFNEEYTWGGELFYRIDENGNRFVNINGRKLRIDQAIALAWIVNKKNRSMPTLKNKDESLTVTNLIWSDDDTDEEIELENLDIEWKPFNKLQTYEISIDGTFRNNKGETHESTFVNGKKLICLPKIGLIDVEEEISNHFDKIKPTNTKISKRLYTLYSALQNEETLDSYCKRRNLKKTTVFSYVYELCTLLDMTEFRKILNDIISSQSWFAMKFIFEHEMEHIFSKPAKDYMTSIDRILCDDPDWKCNPFRFEEIRLLKLYCQRNV